MKNILTICGLALLVYGTASGQTVDNAETGEKDAAKLPTFSDGPYQKAFAVYETQLYRAIINESGIMHVQPLIDGEAVGKPFVCYRLSCYYLDPDNRRQRGRPIVAFNDPGQPKRQPNEVKLSGKLKDDVDFELVYEFHRDKIRVAGASDDPRNIAQPTHFRLWTSFPASHKIPPQMEQAERQELLQDLVVKTKENVGRRTQRFQYPYYSIMKFSGNLEELEVNGLYGERRIELDKRRAKGTLHGYIYANFCPWQGFSVYYTTKPGKMNLRDNELEVSFR